jgi:hypothetical protein
MASYEVLMWQHLVCSIKENRSDSYPDDRECDSPTGPQLVADFNSRNNE